ncbi:MAG: DUF11 domain-containing protein, partial [bacterium]|nr:DUF11 domain-containing protein [bacterium]
QPSGAKTSLYKIEVRVTDHAGLTTTAESEHPFFIINPDGQSVRTLILANPARMQSTMGTSATAAADLMTRLDDLAGHPSVQGLVVDLGIMTHLDPLYASWDADAASPEPEPDLANHVLFGCHGDPLPTGCPGELDGIHDVVRVLLDAYPGVKYLILVGDDRIIPMARMKDRTTGYLESHYTSDDPLDPNAGLTPGGTTVGKALAADRFLSDDPLATLDTIRPEDLRQDDNLFIPELAVGRLVEEPAEIITAIATFISQDGVLDLTALYPDPGHKVLVTGYDFLIDVAKKNRRWWKYALGVPEPHDDDALAPVDGQLISQDWGESTVADRRSALRTHLSGHGRQRYGVMNLNGHATHFEVGVPGQDRFDIHGLPAVDVYGSDVCGTPGLGALDYTGAVVYAVGCHAGLPVPGSCATDAEHSLDLPQTMLARGTMAYLANTGYGWGLLNGIGVSERLVEIYTEEMRQGDTVVVGELLTRTKLRYFFESPRFDAYDIKTSMQWTLYGFPMYAVRTGIASPTSPSLLDSLPSRTSIERFGPMTVERRFTEAVILPPYLTLLELRFDLTADGVYQKHNASGDDLDDIVGCPEPAPGEPEGCYYTFNSLVERATGEADLPLQPYFVYYSRLSATSQHGVLWMGARYDEETDWVPVIGELVTNGGDLSDHGSLPRLIYPKPIGPCRRILVEEPDCRASDLEINSVVLTTGDVVKEEESDPRYTIQRLHREIDLEVFYFNNTLDGEGNCDRSGPLFGDGPYHNVTGRTIHWTVPASDEAGVWRVVVVYDDEAEHRWVPVDLTDAGDGTWTGSAWVNGVERVTYFLQAVDRHGNVTWLEYEPSDPPASGIPLEIPLPLEAIITPGDADLEVAVVAAPNPVLAGDPLSFTIAVTNLGPEPADSVTVSSVLPGGVTYGLVGGTGWSCGEADGTVSCTRDTLDTGPAPEIQLYVTAPDVGGTLSMTAAVSAANDPNPNNDVAPVDVLVIDDTMTDLAVFKEDGGLPAFPGQPITYSITVTNSGPNPVIAATVTDFFPAALHSVTWTCDASVGSFCTESGTGDIVDTVDLLPQGTLLYKVTATVAEGTVGSIENVATVTAPQGMSDFEPLNNSSRVSTPPLSLIFADGFESGDTSAWSSELSPLVIEIDDEAPGDAARYVGRFILELSSFDFDESQIGTVLVVDKATAQPLLALGLVRRTGRLSLVGQMPSGIGSEIETDLLELVQERRVIEIKWVRTEGPDSHSFEIWIDGIRRWAVENANL